MIYTLYKAIETALAYQRLVLSYGWKRTHNVILLLRVTFNIPSVKAIALIKHWKEEYYYYWLEDLARFLRADVLALNGDRLEFVPSDKMKNLGCLQCRYYCDSPYLFCTVKPKGASGESCSDFKLR